MAINSSSRRSDKQKADSKKKGTANVITNEFAEGSDEEGSDNDEFIVHTEGHEEIHITRKAKKQLKMQVAHFKVVKNYNQKTNHQIDEQPYNEDVTGDG